MAQGARRRYTDPRAGATVPSGVLTCQIRTGRRWLGLCDRKRAHLAPHQPSRDSWRRSSPFRWCQSRPQGVRCHGHYGLSITVEFPGSSTTEPSLVPQQPWTGPSPNTPVPHTFAPLPHEVLLLQASLPASSRASRPWNSSPTHVSACAVLARPSGLPASPPASLQGEVVAFP